MKNSHRAYLSPTISSVDCISFLFSSSRSNCFLLSAPSSSAENLDIIGLSANFRRANNLCRMVAGNGCHFSLITFGLTYVVRGFREANLFRGSSSLAWSVSDLARFLLFWVGVGVGSPAVSVSTASKEVGLGDGVMIVDNTWFDFEPFLTPVILFLLFLAASFGRREERALSTTREDDLTAAACRSLPSTVADFLF